MLLCTPNPLTTTLSDRLARVEQRFNAELLSDLPCVDLLTAHLEQYRGKMLRPTLVLLASYAGWPEQAENPGEQERVHVAAAVVEMVHMATLVHDDVLDEAEVRRRGATINRLRGNEAAVMLGDYLISHAYHLCSSLGDVAISKAVAAATNTVCEGELLQLSHREDWSLDERTYLEIIRRKTAALCAVCCRLPGLIHEGRGEGPVADALAGYGEKLGIAFQIIDDVLDLAGDEQEVGKTLGRDLVKGKLTLPLIRWLSQTQGAELSHRLSSLQSAAAGGDLAAVREAVLASDAVDYSRSWARRLADAAVRGLEEQLPDSPARALLSEMASAVLERSR
jgi:octaprenyl-diphosphate synthase